MQDTSQIELYFSKLTSTSQNTLNALETLTAQFTSNQQFVRKILQYLSPQQYKPTACYFNVITLTHPALIQIFNKLSEDIQEDIRGGLLNSVVSLHTNLRCVSAIALLIREIIQMDSLQPWIEPIGQFMKWIMSDDVAVMEAGIQFFIFLMKQTSYNTCNTDLPLHKLSPLLMQNLYQIFTHSQLTEKIRQKILYLFLQVLKTFSIYDGVEDQIVEQSFDNSFEIWMTTFISTLQSTIHHNISIKKYIMKIIVIIFRDMQRYLKKKNQKGQQIKSLYTIWEFCYKIMPVYVWGGVYENTLKGYPNNVENQNSLNAINYSEYYDDDSDTFLPPIESLCHTILEFLSVLTSIPNLYQTLKLSIHHLTNAIFHYLLMTQTESKEWKINPSHFIHQGIMSSMEYQLQVRAKGVGILNEFIEKFGDLGIQAILVVAQKYLLNHNEETTTSSVTNLVKNLLSPSKIEQLSPMYPTEQHYNTLLKLSSCDIAQLFKFSGESWRKLEVALLILGRFSQDIIVFQSKQPNSFDIESFVKGIIKQIRQQNYYTLLKGQSLCCLTRFTQIISIKFKYLFGQLAISACVCLGQDNELPVRIIGCKGITIFLRKIQKHKLELTPEQLKQLQSLQPLQKIMNIPLVNETTHQILESYIELFKNKNVYNLLQKPTPDYILALFHKCINSAASSSSSSMQSFLNLLEEIAESEQEYLGIVFIFVNFINECLKAYNNIVRSQQKNYLKNADLELILAVLKAMNILSQKSMIFEEKKSKQKIIQLLPLISQILEVNQDIQIQVSLTILFKSIIKSCYQNIKGDKNLIERTTSTIRTLLKIPADKSFQSASIYAGNLTILAFQLIFQKKNYEICQEIVLKVFKSRTPSVIQSLVLVYTRIINMHTNKNNFFQITGQMQENIKNIVDFLASFSIQSRMGLKILIDKWLLQQSLFRGKYTKISTFMALSKLFLLNDKRIDNLLVIGFNPSHTNICNDVTAPFKILATLIRCLDNEMGGNRQSQEDSDQQQQEYLLKEQSMGNTLEVNLQKFKQEKTENDEKVGGGLSDRQNQQGSTCYMSAMLEFYDDGEQCDDKTQEDLLFLKDSSIQFQLAEYLTQFFQYLAENKQQYFKECLKGLLKQDVKILQKYVKI